MASVNTKPRMNNDSIQFINILSLILLWEILINVMRHVRSKIKSFWERNIPIKFRPARVESHEVNNKDSRSFRMNRLTLLDGDPFLSISELPTFMADIHVLVFEFFCSAKILHAFCKSCVLF